MAGFAPSGGLATTSLCHEADSDSLIAAAQRFAAPGFDRDGYPRARWLGYTLHEQLVWLAPFSQRARPGFVLAHQMNSRVEERVWPV
jgi:hypothetical protein